MATTAASLQPLKPAASNSHDDNSSPGGSSSQTPVPASASQRGEHRGFGILQHTGPPVHDDIPGLYRDGRVRNPVPSKLKGKTDARKGNFGVMHIDLTTTNENEERDAAAKRTSEGTQLAAKLAQTDRYVPIKRSKYIHRQAAYAVSSSPQPAAPRRRTSPLTAAETKTEQARLLTLLRSLHPVLVVDQLCKALAFFGGMPGAEAPADQSFPDSAESNGPGSLFVGWVAEIFPALGQGSGLNAEPMVVKRPRGRPRGSKNAKGKEKSLRKRQALVARSAQMSESRRMADGSVEDGPTDDSWVDLDDTNPNNEEEDITHVSQGTARQETSTPCNKNSPIAGLIAPVGEEGSSAFDTSIVTPIPKRRGRPKGSKNRPKDGASLTRTAQKPVDAADSTTAMGTVADGTPVPKKRKPGPGRPKGSKNRPKEPKAFAQVTETDSQSASAAPQTEQQRDNSGSGATQFGHQLFSAVNATPARTIQPQSSLTATPPQTSQQQHDSTIAKYNAAEASKGTKRKRKAPTTETKGANNAEISSTTLHGSAQDVTDAVFDFHSGDQTSFQATAQAAYKSKNDTAKQTAKRRKVPTESPQQHPSSGQVDQPSHDSQIPAVSQPSQQRPMTVEGYSANIVGADETDSLSSSRNTMAINGSPQQNTVSPQHAVSALQSGFGQNRGVGQSQASKPMSTAPYSMNHSGRSSQAQYNQTRSAQGLYGHQAQRQHQHQNHQQPQQLQQDSTQQAHAQNRVHGNQHHVMSSGSGRLSSMGHGANSFNGSTADGGYHGLMSQQSSFGTQVPMSASPDGSYRNSTSRSVQNQSPAFQRPVHHAPPSGISYQDYSDPAFLDMAGLDSATQAGLTLSQPSYAMSDTMQRPSSAMNSSYDSASNLGHSFNSSIAAERMYRTLRRQ